ncbi:NBR1 [Branchiostoma lanceolatum]|uniref:NBR1 protein n=1 Tax=Branchiostoma lanceolatum TaxID=7740 RepID=A0A8J9Z821_BRALA|nr:NBR1 [Branchiostoma lanceolatum]
MAETYVLNVDFNGECNVFHVSYNTTWETVDMLLKVNCGEDIKVTYTDEENDQVCINSQAELEEALKCTRNGNDVLSVQVVEAPRTPPENSISRDGGSSVHDEVASVPDEPTAVPELVLVTDEPTKLSEFPKPIEEQPQADKTKNKGKSGSRPPHQLLSETPQPVQMDAVTPDITVTDHTYSKTHEELEKLPDVALGQEVLPSTSNHPRPSKTDIPRSRVCKRKAKSYYASLAESMGATRAAKMAALIGPQVGDGTDQADGRMHVARCLMRSQSLPDTEKPPKWFVDFMKEFKEETGKEITMEVLRSIKETSSSPGSMEGPSSPPPVPGTAVPVPANVQTNGSAVAYVHTGIICDQCEQIIVGIRYKCANCSDYDLCEACEQVSEHNPTHVFLKVRTPAFGAGRKNGKMVPLLKNSLYGDETDKTAQSDTPAASTKPASETREAAVTSPAKPNHEARVREECKKIKEMKAKELKEERRKLKEERQRLKEERKKLKEEQKRRLESGLPLMAYRKWGRSSSVTSEGASDPVYRPLPPPPPVQAPKITSHMDAVFVCDGNMRDGTHVQPGTKFTKHWVMRNEGAGNWTSNTKLTLMWGTITVVSPSEVSVPFLQPQEEGTISVEFQAPERPGEYQSHWRLMHHGLTFGHRVWCSIVVDQPEILEPVLEAANMVQDMQITSPAPANQETEPEESTMEAETGEETDSQKSEDVDKSEEKDHADFADATQAAIAAVARLKTPPSDCSTLISAVDILTAQDLLSFEMLDVGEGREVDNVPNNTPIDMTPRISPLPCTDEDLLFKQNSSNQSQSSIVEVINEVIVDGKESATAAASEVEQMEEGVLVENRMAAIEVKKEPIDEETSSQSSDSTVDSDDYIVVPMPTCFNPEIPLDGSSLSSNTDVAIQTDETLEGADSVDSRCSTPEIVQENGTIRIQDKNEFQPIFPPLSAPINQDPTANQIQVIDLTVDDDDDVIQVKSEPLSNDAAAFLTEVPDPVDDVLSVEPVANESAPEVTTANEMPALEEDSGLVTEEETYETDDDEDDLPIGAAASDDRSNNTVVKHPPEEVAADATEQNSTNADNELNNNTNARRASDRAHATFHADGPIVDIFPTPRGLSAAEFGGAVVNGAINVASNIVTALFGNNGRQNQPYIPPQYDVPPDQDYTPPAPTWPPPPSSVSPMDQLFEMGFGNRELNQRLLDKHGNDLNRVVPELLAMMDNNWHEQRH